MSLPLKVLEIFSFRGELLLFTSILEFFLLFFKFSQLAGYLSFLSQQILYNTFSTEQMSFAAADRIFD